MRKAQQNFLNYLGAIERVVQKNQFTGLQLGIDLQSAEQLKADLAPVLWSS